MHVLGYPTYCYVTVDWDMMVSQSFTNAFGPFFGIRSFDDHGLPGPGVLGTLGVDATTGDVLYETGSQFAENSHSRASINGIIIGCYSISLPGTTRHFSIIYIWSLGLVR